jgi:hypothetical protein
MTELVSGRFDEWCVELRTIRRFDMCMEARS